MNKFCYKHINQKLQKRNTKIGGRITGEKKKKAIPHTPLSNLLLSWVWNECSVHTAERLAHLPSSYGSA